MHGHNGEVEVGKGGYGADKVCVVYALAVIAVGLLEGIPEGVDRTALKPDHEQLGDVQDDVQDGDGDQAATDLRV